VTKLFLAFLAFLDLLILIFSLDAAALGSCRVPMRSSGRAVAGQFVFATFDSSTRQSCLMRVDHDGRVEQSEWSKDSLDYKPEVGGDFSYVSVDGGVYLVSWNGPRIVLDSRGNEKQVIRAEQSTIFGSIHMDAHSFVYFSPRHFTAMYSVPEFDWLGRCRFTPYVSEVLNGEEVFRWKKDDIVPPFRRTYMAFPVGAFNCFDDTHLNWIQDVDGLGYLLSLRNLNTLTFVPRRSPMRSWTLGGEKDEFSLPKEAQFNGQHHPTWNPVDSTLLVFDNGYNPNANYDRLHNARVLEFQLDVTAKKIKSWKTIYTLPQPSFSMGSVDRCGKDCYDISPGMMFGPIVFEYDAAADRVNFEIWLGEGPSIGKVRYGAHHVYRLLPQDKRLQSATRVE
jgi:hypothetical protein